MVSSDCENCVPKGKQGRKRKPATLEDDQDNRDDGPTEIPEALRNDPSLKAMAKIPKQARWQINQSIPNPHVEKGKAHIANPSTTVEESLGPPWIGRKLKG